MKHFFTKMGTDELSNMGMLFLFMKYQKPTFPLGPTARIIGAPPAK
jgi:hypothetical protein